MIFSCPTFVQESEQPFCSVPIVLVSSCCSLCCKDCPFSCKSLLFRCEHRSKLQHDWIKVERGAWGENGLNYHQSQNPSIHQSHPQFHKKHSTIHSIDKNGFRFITCHAARPCFDFPSVHLFWFQRLRLDQLCVQLFASTLANS